MSAYTEYFLNSRSNVVQLELLEITHPNFSKAYRIVRNAIDGVVATIDGTPTQFDYYPLQIRSSGARDDLDSGFTVNLGDLGEVIPQELDAVAAAGGFAVKPMVRYWAFRSDILTAPLVGPLILEVGAFTFTQDGASFPARAPALNVGKTGEFYRLERFPMLRGLL